MPWLPSAACSPLLAAQAVAARHAEFLTVLERGVVISAEHSAPSQFDHKSYVLTVGRVRDVLLAVRYMYRLSPHCSKHVAVLVAWLPPASAALANTCASPCARAWACACPIRSHHHLLYTPA